jgi:PKD repeat protein
MHTYASGGFYSASLTATNPDGSNTASASIFIATTALTDAILQGGPWKVMISDWSVFVGPQLGSSAWWHVPVDFLNGGTAGTYEDWSCMPDDEFTFSAGGVFTYETNGSARNDGYFGQPQGCIDDAAIAVSGNGAAFGSATHAYTFTPASGGNRPIILLTNGPGKAAFIGFYKGFYGGENYDNTSPPNGGFPTNRYEVMGYADNGTKEYLFVSVDISPDHSGSAAWSAILER